MSRINRIKRLGRLWSGTIASAICSVRVAVVRRVFLTLAIAWFHGA